MPHDALEDRTRPPFSGAPAACDVFTYHEHAVGRAGFAGARLVRKVRPDGVSSGKWCGILAEENRGFRDP
jgi:hypothetical protein